MFDKQAFIEMILDHVEHPRGYGRLDDATVSMTFGNPGCGDLITVYLKLDADERIVDYSFVDENPNEDNPNPSCSISRGTASLFLEHVKGMRLAEVLEMDYSALIDDLGGREVAATRPKCITLGMSAVRAAERRLRFEQGQAAIAE
jgi:nitrogen fixation NifU-like protein